MKKIIIRPVITGMLLIICLISCSGPDKSSHLHPNVSVPAPKKPSSEETPIERLIRQLGDDDYNVRLKAQLELEDWPKEKLSEIEPALQAAGQSNNPEVRMRVKQLLKMLALKKNRHFSETFLKEFPDVYRDLARLDTQGKFNLLLQVTAKNDQDNYKYRNSVTQPDLVNLIKEVLLEDRQELSKEQKQIILAICSGEQRQVIDDGWLYGWCEQLPQTVPEVIKLLNDSDAEVRRPAANILGHLGAKEAIPQLIELLKDSDAEVRRSAVSTLGDLRAKEAIPQLIKSLKDSDKNVRFLAAYVFVELRAKEAIPQLIELLNDSDAQVLGLAADTLGKLGVKEAIPQLMELLNDSDAKVRLSAADTLGKLGVKEAIPQLMELLKDSEAEVRGSAAGALGHLGAKEAIPQLMELLKDSEAEVRGSAADTLGKLGVKEAIPQLMELLKDSDKNVRGSAAGALGHLGAKEAIPQLIELLKDSDAEVRRPAANILGHLGAKEAIPQLIELLKDSDAQVCLSAANVLGDLGAKEAIPELMETIKDRTVHYDLRNYCLSSLIVLDKQTAIPELMELTEIIEDPNDNIALRSSIAEELFDRNQEIIPEVIKWLKSTDAGLRMSSLSAIQMCVVYRGRTELIPLLKEAVPELITLLKDTDIRVRRIAAMTLGALKADEAIPELIKLLDDAEPTVCERALTSLYNLRAKECLPKLPRFLKDKPADLKGGAVMLLGELGTKETITEETIGEIIKLLADGSEYSRTYIDSVDCYITYAMLVRLSALSALDKLGIKIPVSDILEVSEAVKDEGDSFNQIPVIFALGKNGGPEVISVLQEFLNNKDSDRWVHAVSAIALVELGAKDKVPKDAIANIQELIRYLNSEDCTLMLKSSYYDKRARAALEELKK